MTPPRGSCAFCREPVMPLQKAAYPVTGWEIERDQGGANRIAGKERQPNLIAHARCLEAHLRRGEQTQMELA